MNPLQKTSKKKKKIELLAPAGNMLAFEAALNAGADAIYLGIDKFSARRGAENFALDELDGVIKQAHLKGVKVYVAFNTLIADEELQTAVESLALISNAGADAVIVQDLGIFDLVKKLIPGLRIHASTQMNTHNLEMVKFLEDKGAKRITLARELSIDEVSKICDASNIEIETFIHGALCFSYSGQCLLSSMVGNRSGNRGLCPQACRLSYDLIVSDEGEEVWPTPGKHLLSTRDLSGIKLIPELANAGIKALKIEGRMKSPEYVATVVRIYRNTIDRYLNNPESFTVSDEEVDELREIFSRGFSESYLKGINDNRMMSFERPSNRGLFLGRTTYMDVYTGRLGLQIKHELCIGDEVEVWVTRGGRVKARVDELYVNDVPVECAPAGSKAVIVVKGKRHTIKPGDRVFRVHNEKLVKTARETISGAKAKRIPVDFSVRIEIGKPVEAKAKVSDYSDGWQAELKSEFDAEQGEKRTLSRNDVIAQFGRLGNTVYEPNSWDIDIEPGAMVPLGKLNDLRRNLVDALNDSRLQVYKRPKVSVKEVKKCLVDAMGPEAGIKRSKPLLAVDLSNTAQALESAKNGADWLYVRTGLSRLDGGNVDFESIAEIKAATGVKVALATGNILHQEEVDSFLGFIDAKQELFDAVLAGNFGIYHALRDFELPLFVDYHVNIFNRISSKVFREAGASRICISPELTLDQIRAITGAVDLDFETLAHGWLEVMTAEHCVPSASKKSCDVCSSRQFYIQDQKGFRFPVEQDINCRSHVYNSKELYLLPNTGNLVNAGISSLRLLLNRYEPEVAGKITALYREAIDLVSSGVEDISSVLKKAERIMPQLKEATTGHYFRAVQ